MTRPALLLLLGACLAGACASSTPVGTAPGTAPVPARFRAIANLASRGRALLAGGNDRGLADLRESLSKQGLALLAARLPNDLRRQDVPRFLAARRLFGRALARYVAAIEAGDDRGMRAAFRDLDDALQGWIDAYAGRPTEAAL